MTVTETREHVMDRILMARRLGGLYQAEADGMLRALYYDTPDADTYASIELQVRYLVGFRDGRMMLEVATRATDPHPLATADKG